MSDKDEALLLADALLGCAGPLLPILPAAACLRRQHAEIKALKAECDALRDALTQYGWHQEGCPQYTRYTHPELWPACTCGFDAAREEGK